MAYELRGFTFNLEAAVDQEANRALMMSGGKCVVNDGTKPVIGVSLYKVLAGEQQTICKGIMPIIAKGAINAGDRVKAVAGGAVSVTTDVGDVFTTGTPDTFVQENDFGVALTSAAGDNEFVSVLFSAQ